MRKKSTSRWSGAGTLWTRYGGDYFLLVSGVVILLFFTLLALTGEWLVPNNPVIVNMSDRLQPPSLVYPLGTDHLGRCILSRLMAGAHTTLGLSLAVIAVVTAIGVPVGLLSGYRGGRLDAVLMRIADGLGALPEFLIAVAVAGFLGPGLINVMIAIACVKWIGYARIVRGIVMSERNKEYIMASIAASSSDLTVITRHLLRHVASPLAIVAAGDIGRTILLISALSYLGLGAQPPAPEWGAMLNDGRPFFMAEPQLMIYPGLCILLVVLACNQLSDGLREYLDVRGGAARRQL
ncbi:nickel transporter permease [Paenibacillus thalictri]|uniref:ABC transporter permease subunit n=1 Tax=Paenibacillus thalictri TaxID=2527873 RepID=A0A4Q9DHS0_9BACL|nr:nickel transporter permease [Paenibacillus thalictri]TBL69907.1 ABC transporter permease subunit [Paenibacillus thalictri]